MCDMYTDIMFLCFWYQLAILLFPYKNSQILDGHMLLGIKTTLPSFPVRCARVTRRKHVGILFL